MEGMLIFIVGFSLGVCFAAICVAVSWLLDSHHVQQQIIDVREAAFKEGYEVGYNARSVADEEEMKELERRAEELFAEMDEVMF